MRYSRGNKQSEQGHRSDSNQRVVVYLRNDDDRERTVDLSIEGAEGFVSRYGFTLAPDEEQVLPLDGEVTGADDLSVQVESVGGMAVMEFDPEKRLAPTVVVREGTVLIAPADPA